MSIKRSYISSPALTFAILCIGLGCIVAATLKQNLAIAGLVAALPALLCILILHLRKPERFIIRKSKFPQNPKRSVRFSGKRTKRSVQKRKARNTQKAETKVL